MAEQSTLQITGWNVWYGGFHALRNITASIPASQITAIVGPSGCGKSTLLRSLNRLVELEEGARVQGEVLLNGQNIYAPEADVTEIRTRIGLLAQKPFPLPMSIFDNVAYGPRLHGLHRGHLADVVEQRLRQVHLWDEVKDRLKRPAARLSVGQQQRLCLARALAVDPDLLLADESTSALDPHSARAVEDLLEELKNEYTIVIVTHNLGQAERLADYVLFLWLGELIEVGPAERVFGQPTHDLTRSYLERRFG
ncbi:MAG: phosphate ABC transporter ATP-binding protein [Anaerolineae bacterium]|nr:phosphate ABC transporter ATP-binding protein [Anaerolineae bacterium]